MRILSFLLTVFLGISALAQEHGAHAEGIPWKSIFWQCFNLAIVFAIIYFAARKQIVAFFKQRQMGFLHQAKKAEEAKAQAEKQFMDIKHRLEHLNATYQESLQRAQAEAADLKKQMVVEAQDQAKRIKEEAQITVKIESQRAQRDLHEKFVQETISLARQVLQRDIGSADHQKLQTEFTKNIEAVSP
jgi:F-type H+-transporting ATPase subunit b